MRKISEDYKAEDELDVEHLRLVVPVVCTGTLVQEDAPQFVEVLTATRRPRPAPSSLLWRANEVVHID